MDINFKGQRALVTGAGKGKIFFFMYWKITELYRERMARAPGSILQMFNIART